MVAIVAGNGLGLFNASLNSLGGVGAQAGNGGLGQAGGRAYVNIANGNLVLQFLDEQLSGAGQDLIHQRTYNSRGMFEDSDGDGWRWDGERRVALNGGRNEMGSSVTRIHGDGHQSLYVWNGSAYVSSEGSGAHDRIDWDDVNSKWVWTEGSSRIVERYDNNTGLLKSRVDANGNAIVFDYDNGRLSAYTDQASGQRIELVYGSASNSSLIRLLGVNTYSLSSNGTLGAAIRQVNYGYDLLGRLTSVITDLTPGGDNSTADGKIYVTNYGYDGDSNRIASISQSDGSTASFTYEQIGATGLFRVKTVSDQFGIQTFNYYASRTDVVDANNLKWSYHFDTDGQLLKAETPSDQLGTRYVTEYQYDTDGNVMLTTDARGNSVAYRYDAQGNRILERDAEGNTITRTYNSQNQLLTESRYLSPDVDGDGSALPGDAEATRFVYDSAHRLRFVISPEGRVSESRYNGFGQLVASIAYTAGYFPVSSLAFEEVPTEATLQTWSTAQDKTKTQRTDFEYDSRGNLAKNIQYAVVDSTGTGVINSQTLITHLVHDESGRLLQKIELRGNPMAPTENLLLSQVYDGMGRLLSQTGAQGTSTYTYNGAQRKTVITRSDGFTLASLFDDKGRLLTITETTVNAVSREVRYFYDEAGQLRATQDANGGKTYTFYDQIGRVSGRVDVTGVLVEYRYNENGQLTNEIRYANKIDTSSWMSGDTVTVSGIASIRPNASDDDRNSSFQYDAAGRLLISIDSVGTETRNRYNGASRLVQQVINNERATRYFYDHDGRLVGVIDADGYLTETVYDAAGNAIKEIRYPEPVETINSAPIWPQFNTFTLEKGVAFEQLFQAFDYDPADAQTLQYQWVSGALPAGMSFASVPPKLVGSPTSLGDFQFTLRATDSKGLSTDLVVNLKVVPENKPPVWSIPSLPEANEGSAYEFMLPAATDPEGTSQILYSLVGSLPSGLSFDAASRTLSGTPTAFGEFQVTFRAREAGANGKATEIQLSLNVLERNYPPIWVEGTMQVPVKVQAYADSAGNANVDISWPEIPNLATGNVRYELVAILPHHARPGEMVEIALPASSYSNQGTVNLDVYSTFHTVPNQYDFYIRAYDAQNTLLLTSPVFNISLESGRTTRTSTSIAVNAGTITPPIAVIGQEYLYTLPKAFDPEGKPIIYALNSTLPNGLSFNATTREISGIATETGSFTLQISASDQQNSTVLNLPLIVSTQANQAPTFNTPLNFVVYESTPFNVVLPDAVDPEGQSVRYDIVSGLVNGLSFNTATKTLSGVVAESQTLTLRVRITDPHGASNEYDITLQVRVPNLAPVWAIGSSTVDMPINVVVGSGSNPNVDIQFPKFVNAKTPITQYRITAYIPQPSNPSETFTITHSSGGGTISFQGYHAVPGTYSFELKAYSSTGQLVGQTDRFDVALKSNHTSRVVTQGSYLANDLNVAVAEINQPYQLTLPQAYDPEQSALTYSIVGELPAWLSFNASTRTLTGTPTAAGIHEFSIRATDAEGAFVDYQLSIRAAPPNTVPVWQSLGSASVGAGLPISHVLPAASDVDGDELSYSVVSGLPVGMAFDAVTRTLSGQTMSAGTHTVTFSVSDGRGGQVNRALTLTVRDASYVPVWPTGLSTVDMYVKAIVGSGTNPNITFQFPTLQNSTVAVTKYQLVSYIPHPTNPGVFTEFVFSAGGVGVGTTATSNGYHKVPGTYQNEIRALDANNNVIAKSEKFSVAMTNNKTVEVKTRISYNAAQVQLPAMIQGNAFSYTLPRAYDAQFQSLTYSVIGSLPPGLSFQANTRTLSGTPSVSGHFEFSVRAKDPAGDYADLSFAVDVAEAVNTAPTWSTLSAQQARVADPFTVNLPAALDAQDGSLTYEVVGDLPAGLSFDASTRRISGTPSEQGEFSVTIRAIDSKGLSSDTSFVLTIASENLSPAWVNHGAWQLNIKGVAGEQVHRILPSATDPEGGSVTYSIVGNLPAGLTFNSATRVISGFPTAENFSQVTFLATDPDGKRSELTVTFEILRANAAPYLNIEWPRLMYVYDGSHFEFSLPQNAFVDPDGDTLTYSLYGSRPSWVQIDEHTGRVFGDAPIPESSIARRWVFNVMASDPRGERAFGAIELRILAQPASSPNMASSGFSSTSSSAPILTFNAESVATLPSPTPTQPPVESPSFTKTDAAPAELLAAVAVSEVRSTPASDALSGFRPSSTANALQTTRYFDASGRLQAELDAQGFLTEFVRDESLNQTQTIRYATHINAGHQVESLQNLKAQVSSGGMRTETIRYDAFGRVTSRTNAEGTVTAFEYDSLGRLVREISAQNDAAETRTRTIRYDGFGNITGELSGEGSARLTAGMSASQQENVYSSYGVRHAYDASGRLLHSIDAAGNKSLYFYDVAGRLTHTINAAGEVQQTLYTSFGEVKESVRYANRLSSAQLATLSGGAADATLEAAINSLKDAARDARVQYRYDDRGLVISHTDAEGFKTTNSYNAFGELELSTRQLDGAGTTTATRFYHDRRGNVITAIGDFGGLNATQQWRYDAFGRLVSSKNALNQETLTEYQDSGRTIVVTDPLNRTRRNEFDAFGRVLKTYDGLNEYTEYRYDDAARTITVITPELRALNKSVVTSKNRHGETTQAHDAHGNSTRYAYNRDGQLTESYDARNVRQTLNEYDNSGRLKFVTDARGVKTELQYDAANRVKARIVDVGTGKLNLRTEFEYDSAGRTITVTEGHGTAAARVTQHIYDRNGQLKQTIIDPNGLQLTTTYSYDGAGNVLRVARGSLSNLNEQVTQYVFDKLNRRTQEIIDPIGLALTTEYRYDLAGRVTRKIDANQHSTWYLYDAAGQLTRTVNAEGEVTSLDYDANGRLAHTRRYVVRVNTSSFGDVVSSVSVSNHADDQRSYNVYDKDGRQRFTLIADSGSNWTIAENLYDANGNVIETRRYDKFLTETRINAIASGGISEAEVKAELTTLGYSNSVLGNSQRTRFAYDANNRLRFTVDVLGYVSENIYDAAGHVTSQTRFALAPTLTAFDESGIDGKLDRNHENNRTTHMAYDSAGRLRFVAQKKSASEWLVSETVYDALGQVLKQTQFNTPMAARSQYRESDIHGAVNRSDVNNRSTEYVYDAAGRVRFTIDALGALSENVYAQGSQRLAEQRRFDLSVPTATARTLTALSELRAERRVGELNTRGEKYQYDSAGRLRQTTDALGVSESYGYDNNGNRTSLTNKKQKVWTYTYDKVGRLLTETTPRVDIQLSDGTQGSRALITRLAYNAFGDVQSRTEGIVLEPSNIENALDARTTAYGYDRAGRQNLTTEAGWYDVSEKRFHAEKNGQADRFQRTVEVTFDALGNAVRNKIRVGAGDTDFIYQYKTYDQLGRVVHDVDALRQVSTFSYNAFGEQQTATRQSLNAIAAPTAGGFYRVSDITPQLGHDTNARTVTMAYDNLGRKTQVTQASVDSHFYSSTSASSNAQTPLAAGTTGAPVTRFEYNAFGETVKERVLVSGNEQTGAWRDTLRYYDHGGRQTLAVDALGYGTETKYNPFGEVARVIEYAQKTHSSHYDAASKPVFSLNEQSRQTVFSYDALGRQKTVTRIGISYYQFDGANWQKQTSQNVLVQTLEYDALGNVTAQIDAANNRSETRYNDVGHVIETKEASRSVAGSGADVLKNPVITTPTTTLTLDAFGNVVKQTRTATGIGEQTIHRRYDFLGNAIETTDAAGNKNFAEYDVASRTIREYQHASANLWDSVHTQTIERRYEYDLTGRQIATFDVFMQDNVLTKSGQHSVYNAFGEIEQEIRAWGGAEQTLGALNQAVIAKNRYDQNGRLVERQAADGITRYFYDLTGNVTRQEQRGNQNDSDGNKTRVTETGYDALGRAIIQRTPQFHGINQALGQTLVELNPLTKQTLDRWGNALTRTDQAGFTTHYVYNHDNQIIEERLPTVTAVKTNDKAYQANVVHEIHYNLQGLVAETVDRVEDDPNTAAGDSQANEARTLRTRKNHYNQLGQLTASIDATNIRTDYAYDANGNRVGSKDALGHVFVETYNAQGQVTGKSLLRIKHTERIDYPAYQDGKGIWHPARSEWRVTYKEYTGQSFEANPSSQVTQELVAVTLSTSSYDTAGRKIADGDGLGYQRYYKLDERGNVVEARSAAGVSTHSRYNEFGQKLSELDALNNGSQFSYNLATGDNFGFGQTLTMTIGQNRTTSYQYNEFGQLAGESYSFQTGSRSYSYHGNGLLQSIVDVSSKGTPGIDGGVDYLETQVTMRYDYTIRGEKARESYTTFREYDFGNYEYHVDHEAGVSWEELTSVTVLQHSTQKTMLLSYDALGRVEKLTTPTENNQNQYRGQIEWLDYHYDELGNRRKVATRYKNINGETGTAAHWYAYDLEGRLTISKGMMLNDQIVAYEGGVAIAYDNLGRRLGTSSYTGTRTSNIPGEPVSTYHQFDQERYFYDELGQLTGIDKRLHERLVLNASHYRNDVDVTDSGWKLSNRREYDGRGYVSKNIDFDDNGAFKGRTETSYLADGRTASQSVYDKNDKLTGRVGYDQPGAYDAAGNLKQYRYEIRDGNTTTATYTYDYTYTTEYGGYKESKIKVTADTAGYEPGYTHNAYDLKGQLLSQTVQQGNSKLVRNFSYDGEGHILTKSERKGTENAKHQDYFYANGQTVGTIGDLSGTDFDFNFTPVSERYPSSAPGQYVINSGDTLAGIAQMVFGDARLWYLIADANSLQVGQHDALSDVGKTLKIPNVISNIHNDSNTFKPYNPSEIIGDTTPSPVPPPPPKNKCETLIRVVSMVVGIIVGIIVTYATWGNAAIGGAIGGALSTHLQQVWQSQANGDFDYGNSIKRHLNPSGGNQGEHFRGVLIPDANGVPNYDDTATAISAAAGAAGAYVGGAMNGVPVYLAAAAGAASGYAVNYALNKAADREIHWSNRQLLGSMAAAMATVGVAEMLGGNVGETGSKSSYNNVVSKPFEFTSFLRGLVSNFAGSAANHLVRKGLGDDSARWNGKQSFFDAFGNAMGAAAAGAITYKMLPPAVKKAMEQNPAAGDEYYRAVNQLRAKGMSATGAQDAAITMVVVPAEIAQMSSTAQLAYRNSIAEGDKPEQAMQNAIAANESVATRSNDESTSQPENAVNRMTVWGARDPARNELLWRNLNDLSMFMNRQMSLNDDLARRSAIVNERAARREQGPDFLKQLVTDYRAGRRWSGTDGPVDNTSIKPSKPEVPFFLDPRSANTVGQTYDAQVLDNEFWGAVGQAEAGSAVLLGSLQRGYANIGLSNFKLFGEVPKTTIELLFESPGRYHSWISVDAMPSVDKFHFGANAQNAEAFIDFTKGAKSVGNKAKYIGPGLSLMEAYNTQADPTSDTGDKFRDWGKFAVDSTVLGLEFVSTKFTPWGWGYTIADFSVSFMDYTPTYGTEAGIPKSSWTALWYWNADAQYVANQQRFEMVKKFPTMTGRRW